MHPPSRSAHGRIAQALAFLTISCALSVQAAPSKQPAKKQVSTTASKRAAAKDEPRKRVVVKVERQKAAGVVILCFGALALGSLLIVGG